MKAFVREVINMDYMDPRGVAEARPGSERTFGGSPQP